jgi:hypothetical protein
LKSTTLERELTCKCGAPIPTGGRSSNTKEEDLSMLLTIRLLESRTIRIKKLMLFNHKTNQVMHPKDGELSILTRWEMKHTPRRVKWTKLSASFPMNHST